MKRSLVWARPGITCPLEEEPRHRAPLFTSHSHCPRGLTLVPVPVQVPGSSLPQHPPAQPAKRRTKLKGQSPGCTAGNQTRRVHEIRPACERPSTPHTRSITQEGSVGYSELLQHELRQEPGLYVGKGDSGKGPHPAALLGPSGHNRWMPTGMDSLSRDGQRI